MLLPPGKVCSGRTNVNSDLQINHTAATARRRREKEVRTGGTEALYLQETQLVSYARSEHIAGINTIVAMNLGKVKF